VTRLFGAERLHKKPRRFSGCGVSQEVVVEEKNPFSTALDLNTYVVARVLHLQRSYAQIAQRANRRYFTYQGISGLLLVISIIFLFANALLYCILGLFLALTSQLLAQVMNDTAAQTFYEATAQRLASQLDGWKLAQANWRDDAPPALTDPIDTERQRLVAEQTAMRRARITNEFVEGVEDALQFAREMWVLSSFFRAPSGSVNQQAVINDLMENGLVLLNRQKQVSPIRYAKNTIFISYRRADSEDIVGRIWDRLSAYFGHEAIFRDVQTISAGEDFEKRILSAVESCSVLLTIIGGEWERIADVETGTTRLHNPKDYVRREIVAALTRSDAVVVPVLVRGAKMPTCDHLPDDLQDLTMRNAVAVRSDPDFEGDIKRLITAVELSVSRQA